jgi:serine/threonine-protein kinase RsbW
VPGELTEDASGNGDPPPRWPAPWWVRVPATAPQVGRLRRGLRSWLADDHLDPDTSDDLVLAVSEALENCCDHAYPADVAIRPMTLSAAEIAGRLVITVDDEGRWQPPDTGPSSRGRGLDLIRQLVDEVEIVGGPQGTHLTLTHRRVAP